MKKIICTLIILSSTFMIGCFNYRDMNKLLFSLSAIFDINENENVVIYEEFFKATRFGEQKMGREDRVLVRGEGQSVLDAFYDINTFAGNKIAYDVNKVLIYTEKAARRGLQDFVDSPLRNQRPTLREFMFVYCGNPSDLMNVNIEDEKFIGLFLDNTMIYQGNLMGIASLRLDEYSINRLMGSRINIMPIIKTSEKSLEPRIEIDGAAIIEDDKMVDKIDFDEVTIYKFLTNNAKIGTITTKNPEYKDKVISLDNLKSKTTKSLKYNGERIEYNIKIDTMVSLGEAQKGITITNDKIKEEIEVSAAETLKHKSENFLKKFKDKNIDILNIQEQLKEKYHGTKVDNIMNKVDFNIDIKVMIEGSQKLKDS